MSVDSKLISGPARRWYPVVITLIVALAGYFGAWIPHRSAGLVVTGVDFAEYVKFLPAVQGGQIVLVREAFYLPLFAASLSATFVAGRRALPRTTRLLALLAAVPLALAMLPPAWSPGLLLQPEFRLQLLAIGVCVLAVPLIVITRFVPDSLILLLSAALALAAAIWPAWSFVQVLPSIRGLYATDSLLLGWGFGVSVAGWLAAALFALARSLFKPTPIIRHPA